jgi:hypothetical protein
VTVYGRWQDYMNSSNKPLDAFRHRVQIRSMMRERSRHRAGASPFAFRCEWAFAFLASVDPTFRYPDSRFSFLSGTDATVTCHENTVV